MKLTAELLRKHANAVRAELDEARVKSYTRRSKTGKAVQVRDYERGQLTMKTINRIKGDEINRFAKKRGISPKTVRNKMSSAKSGLHVPKIVDTPYSNRYWDPFKGKHFTKGPGGSRKYKKKRGIAGKGLSDKAIHSDRRWGY